MNNLGKRLVVIGLFFIVLALGIKVYDIYEDNMAGINSSELVTELKDVIDDYNVSDSSIVYQSINGYDCLGIITIPSINIELPIISSWDYNRLKVAPCVFQGSIEENNLVICAHSYKYHFRYLSKLESNDYVFITTLNNETIAYQVVYKEVIDPTDQDKVTDNEFDLTLFSCKNGGTQRMVIYCNKVN